MLLTTIRKEMLSNILSMRYGLTVFLFLAVTLSATVVRTELFKRQDKDYAQSRSDRAAIALMARSWFESMEFGVNVEKRPNPLAIFAGGLENEMARSISIDDSGVPDTGMRKIGVPSARYALGLDMVLIVSIVCSLLALLLAYDAVCGEREQGTLKVLLAGPLPRDTVILGKIVASLLTVLIPLAMTWLLNTLYVAFVAQVHLTADHYARLACMAVLSMFYVAFFCALGTAVSCWVHRSATSLVVSLFLWSILVLAIPNILPMAVKHLAPIPAESKMMQEKRAIRTQVDGLQQQKREEWGGLGTITTVPQFDSAWRAWASEEYQKREEQLDRFYHDRVKRQLVLNQQIARVSPSGIVVFAGAHIAGTGAQDFIRRLRGIDEYRREVKAKMTELQRTLDALRERQQRGESVMVNGKPPEMYSKPIDPAVWPTFEPVSARLTEVLNVCWIDLVILAGMTVALFMGAFVGFIRYDVK